MKSAFLVDSFKDIEADCTLLHTWKAKKIDSFETTEKRERNEWWRVLCVGCGGGGGRVRKKKRGLIFVESAGSAVGDEAICSFHMLSFSNQCWSGG
jgi:hypothetical protein